MLDTSQDGEIDADECTARRLTSRPIDATPARRRGGAVPIGTRFHYLMCAQGGGDLPRPREAHGGPQGRAGAARWAAAAADGCAEFLSAARKVFEMIDVDSGTLTKQEIIAVKENKE